MELVVDANILISALIKEGVTAELLFKNEFHLYAPEFIFVEFEKYKALIKKKTGRTDEDFDHLLNLFQRRILLVPFEEIKPFLENAKQITPDMKDAPYVALALKLECGIWSNDRELKEKQHFIDIYSTHELVKL